MTRILIITPFRNEDHSIPLYIKSLTEIDYPKNLIDIFWLENDSSDKTLNMLKKYKPQMKFRSINLKSIRILDKVTKRVPGEYVKDIKYGIGKRKKPWLVIWNQHFLPVIKKSKAKYILCWWADAVAPPNMIKAYLEVFKIKKNAGWVGGKIYRRKTRARTLGSPVPHKKAKSKEIVEITFAGHCWMCPKSALTNITLAPSNPDIFYSLTRKIQKRGLKIYYQPKVFLKHVSTDGKIYDAKGRSS